jgi:hypothetical protein
MRICNRIDRPGRAAWGMVVAAALVLLGAAPGWADVLIVPAASAGVEGDGSLIRPLDSSAQTTQFVIGAPLLGGLPVGSLITGLQFRQQGGEFFSLPPP